MFHLKRALLDNSGFNTRNVLSRFGFEVPNDAFTWITSQKEASYDLLDLLFHRKQLCDDFINDFLEVCNSEREITTGAVVEKLSAINCNYNMKDLFFIQELLSDGSVFSVKMFPITNVRKNYKNLCSCLDEMVVDTAYCAQPKILGNLIKLSKVYNIQYQYQPLIPGRHKAVYDWLQSNIAGRGTNVQPGWRSGPDSGKWPSSNLEDYFEVCFLLKQLIV